MNDHITEQLQDVSELVVTQNADWSESFTGYEKCNKYQLSDEKCEHVFAAAEFDQSFLLRNLLEAKRPFDMNIFGLDGQILLRIHRPFKFFFSEISVSTGTMEPIGSVKQYFALFNRCFGVVNKFGREILTITGPFLRPWTFEIFKGPRTIGKIHKQWSGLAREAFSNADTFGITFPQSITAADKALLIGAVFLIDFEYFENGHGRRRVV